MTDKRLRVTVHQVAEERIPTRWQRLFGVMGNPDAWFAEACGVDRKYDRVYGRGWGYTRRDAISLAVTEARREMERIDKMQGTKEEFYV